MATQTTMQIRLTLSSVFSVVVLLASPLLSQQTNNSKATTATQPINREQATLAEQYRLLEEKLFSLHEYEKQKNPGRSKLLERAYIQSQSNMTALQMNRIVELINSDQLKDAEKEQKKVLGQLDALLQLLQSEDRGKRTKDAIQRHQVYLKEVERLLRIQKGIRGQADGGIDSQRLIKSENQAAKRTGKLADEIKLNESPPKDELESSADNSDPSSDLPDDSPQNSADSNQPSADGSPEQPNGSAPNPTSQPDASSLQARVRAAEKKMREAAKKLDSANQGDASEEMHQAEAELAQAKKELEEILRQLREEDVERTLAMLESRFRQMLERQVRVLDSTNKLNQPKPTQRGTEFEIKAGKLSLEQKSIATEAARALVLLREDGSSIAFPVTVEELHDDMLQVADRLSSAKVGPITIQIEEDIIETLNYLVQALVDSQQNQAKSKQANQQQGKPEKPGDEPLVDQLAEIKMLRGLQERILRRHERYSAFLENPEDAIGYTSDPDLTAALQRLAEKQAKLTEIARDIINEKNQ